MSFDRRSYPLTRHLALAIGAALLLTSAAHAAGRHDSPRCALLVRLL